MGVSFGEALGEKGVAAIREDEVARRIHDLERQQLEEQGHSGGTRLLVEELFPEHFDSGRYRYEGSLFNREYYFTVREENRRWLKQRGRYSRGWYRSGRLRLDELVTGTFALERVNDALDALDGGEAIRSVIVVAR